MFATLLLGFQKLAHACDKHEPTREMSRGPHDFSAGVPDPRLWREDDGGEPLFIRARVLEEIDRNSGKGWVAGYEFVLAPR